jgi:hypothetical protein
VAPVLCSAQLRGPVAMVGAPDGAVVRGECAEPPSTLRRGSRSASSRAASLGLRPPWRGARHRPPLRSRDPSPPHSDFSTARLWYRPPGTGESSDHGAEHVDDPVEACMASRSSSAAPRIPTRHGAALMQALRLGPDDSSSPDPCSVGAGSALTIPTITALLVGSVPSERAGTASGALNTTRQLGGAIQGCR